MGKEGAAVVGSFHGGKLAEAGVLVGEASLLPRVERAPTSHVLCDFFHLFLCLGLDCCGLRARRSFGQSGDYSRDLIMGPMDIFDGPSFEKQECEIMKKSSGPGPWKGQCPGKVRYESVSTAIA